MFVKEEGKELATRLLEPRRFIQVVTGPRQVGKTTAVTQALETLNLPSRFLSADAVGSGPDWIRANWEQARQEMRLSQSGEFVLVIDEIQKIANWSEVVKAEWDADTRTRTNVKLVLLGSSRVLVSKGLSESLMGRFEEIRMSHWTYPEMQTAFGMSLPEFIYFGGYPGAASLIRHESRWRAYIQSAIVDAAINRDVLMDSPVGKPALLRRTFELAASYSGEILSLTKMLGELQDAGNTTTLAGYLTLLDDSGLVGGLQKYAHDTARKRASIPKFQVHNSALKSVILPDSFHTVQSNAALWGRYVESAVGAYLVSQAFRQRFEVLYWRDGALEVDFVLRMKGKLLALEVKTSSEAETAGMHVFAEKFAPDRSYLVGPSGMPLEDFFATDIFDML